jgi:endopolyphosphatase
MNVDHFFWLDVHDLSMEPTDPDIHAKRSVLHEDLREDISDLPEEIHHSDYVVVNVAPSVIPAYLPSFRVYQYNITEYAGPKVSDGQSFTRESWDALDVGNIVDDEDEEDESIEVPPRRPARSVHSTRRIGTTGKRKHRHRHPEKPDCSKPENSEKYACRPWGPRHANSTSPSRTNTLWSLLGYAQYYMPDLEDGTKKHPPRFKLEYVTHAIEALRPPSDVVRKKGGWIPPVPKHLLPKSLRDGNGTSSKFAPYQLEDLTIPKWIELARKLGDSKRMWKKFLGYMYMGQDPEGKFDRADEETTTGVEWEGLSGNGAQMPLRGD